MKNSKVGDLFRAAGRLACEWRDTLGYTGLVCATSVGLAMTGNNPTVALGACILGLAREGLRFYAWGEHSTHMILAGDFSKKDIDPRAFSDSAFVGTIGFTALSCGILTGAFSAISPQLGSFFALGSVHEAYSIVKMGLLVVFLFLG